MSATEADDFFDAVELESFEPSHDDQESWLVSYADLITLLFIFFAVMLSISTLNRAKFDRLTRQLNASNQSDLSKLQSDLDKQITDLKLKDKVSTSLSDEGLLIQLNESVLFESAKSTINPEGLRAIGKIDQVLASPDHQNYRVAVEGHTDSRPIRTHEFESNWSLSASRAVNVLHYMLQQGLSEKRLSVRAYADTRPKPNTSAEDAQNRRVTLLVY